MTGAATAERSRFTSGAPIGICVCGADTADHSGWDNHGAVDQAEYYTNGANPILIAIRQTMDAFDSWDTVFTNVNDDEAIAFRFPHASRAHVDHAKAVVRKLAAAAANADGGIR